MEKNIIYQGDSIESIKQLPDESVDCVVTSPPYYGLRDYGVDGQIGLEETPELYIQRLVELFREIRRVLKKDGTIWVNIGDSYWGGGWRNAEFNENSGEIQKGSKGTYCGKSMPNLKGYVNGYKPKDLIGIPWMLAFALRADGWYLRQDIIWHKPNPMPESVTDRCTKSHEYIFLLSKSEKYYFDNDAIQEDCVDANYQNKEGKSKERTQKQGYSIAGSHRDNSGGLTKASGGDYTKRNKRDVWSVNVKPNKEAHFATYPEELIAPCILAGCREKGIVLDPFMGSGTTGIVARKLNRNYIGCELNPDYVEMAERRISEHGENLFNQ